VNDPALRPYPVVPGRAAGFDLWRHAEA